MAAKTIDKLWGLAINEKPRHFNFGEGYAETWDVVYPDIEEWTVEQCRQWLDDEGYDHLIEQCQDSEDPEEWQSTVRNGMMEAEKYAPMMNYIYPLPELKHGPETAQELIEDTNCVIVLIKDTDDEYPVTPYMALSGGGMDLSWDICEAYMLLGYLPPVHFCTLPDYAGMKLDEKAKWIISACRESCQVQKNWANSRLRDLENLEKSLAKNK
jgi:hypothetical protein